MGWTLSKVVEVTGAKRRSVQLWADAGIIHAVEGTDRAGTGVHRRFDSNEVKLIALLVPLAKWGVPIGWLRHFARSFRDAFKFDQEGTTRSRMEWILARAFERAAAGEGHNYLVFAHSEKVLSFDIITDEHGPAYIDPARIEDERMFLEGNIVIGILNLNASLRGLEQC